MAIAPRYQDTVYIGADYSLAFEMKDPDGNIMNLSGCSVLAKFKYRKSDSDSIPLTCMLNTTTGEISVGLSKTVTITMTQGVGFYDIVLITSQGETEPLLVVDLDIVVSPTLSPEI